MTPTRITKKELEEMLGVEFDYAAKMAFLKMTREEQLMALLSAQAYLRGEIANIKKWQIHWEEDAQQYRRKREREENNGVKVDTGDLTEKISEGIRQALAARFDFWVYLRDKVLPHFISVAITVLLILMGLFLSGNFPW